jgi:hypothetical protein
MLQKFDDAMRKPGRVLPHPAKTGSIGGPKPGHSAASGVPFAMGGTAPGAARL